VLLQLAAGLAMIIGGARGFVFGVEALATALGVTALTPLAADRSNRHRIYRKR